VSIVLHIDRLVLDEALLDGERPLAVRSAIERELAATLAQPFASKALQRIDAAASLPVVPLPSTLYRQDLLGSRVARAVQLALRTGKS
jgi:hypothetical protein